MSKNILGLDYGSKKIGVARVNEFVKIVEPLGTVMVNGEEIDEIKSLIDEHQIDLIVLGWPRNMSGEETKQTQEVLDFEKRLEQLDMRIERQDESLTSVEAEDRLKSQRKSYQKVDIDTLSAAIILEDYLRRN